VLTMHHSAARLCNTLKSVLGLQCQHVRIVYHFENLTATN
jgi:hypothetical protein